MKRLLSICLVASIGLALTSLLDPGERPVTVILLRHAEIQSSTLSNRDPELSPTGVQRSEALSRLLSHASVTHLFCSEFRRTHDTLLPLSERTKLSIEEVSARTPDKQLQRLSELAPGSVAVVVGHSNTIPAMLSELDAGSPAQYFNEPNEYQLGHDEYDRLFMVTLSGTELVANSAIELRYGLARVSSH